jgi:hypothetical protein
MARDGRHPVVYYPCRYETFEGETLPLPPGRASKLYQLLQIVCGTRGPQIVQVEAVIGWRFLVRLRTVKEDWAGDRKPEQLWRSVVDKILDARPPKSASSEPSVSSNQQVAISNLLSQRVVGSREVQSLAAGQASSRQLQPSRQATAAGRGSASFPPPRPTPERH